MISITNGIEEIYIDIEQLDKVSIIVTLLLLLLLDSWKVKHINKSRHT